MKKLDFACNPYLPGKEHVPDGEPHIFGDRLYVFGSHDELGYRPVLYRKLCRLVGCLK